MEPDQIIRKILGREAFNLWRVLAKQKLKRVQALVFLQGDRLDRVPAALSLYKKGLVKKIFITGNNDLIGRGKRQDENDISLDKLKEVFLKNGVFAKSFIIDSQAYDTKDQATNTIKTALKNDWKVIIVLTSPYHILRAYLTFVKQALEQKWSGKIIMYSADLNWLQIPSGRSKNAIEMLILETEKIKKYKNNIATIKEGLHYIQ